LVGVLPSVVNEEGSASVKIAAGIGGIDMNIAVLAFGLGALLLLVGILGGGFEIKELKIPKVGWPPRLVALLAGACFIVLGIGQNASVSAPPSPNIPLVRGDVSKPTPPVANEEPVEFSIYDQLGQNEISEQVTILLEGRRVGTLTVNEEYPGPAMISVTVPQTGRYSYTAEATAAFDFDGERRDFACAGQGTINVRRGKIFDLRGSINSSNTLLISLEERPQ
jgi:hypothetical protein